MTTIVQEIAPTIDIPIAVLESLLRDYLGNQAAIITDYANTPFAHQGTNDSTTIFRTTFTWSLSARPLKSYTTTWIIKHWKAGGIRDSVMGITMSREVLAWERGWLRSAALPSGIIVPLIGAWRSPDSTEAWLAMEDVSTELSVYPRMGLPGDQVISHTQAILARLAHFHVMWEQPERQAELDSCGWLRRPEGFLWDMASTYARALGRPHVAQLPPGVNTPPPWDGLRAELEAFLQGRSADERQLWEDLLVNRRALVEGLAPCPHTLLHHDLDDRNIGLRWSSTGAEMETFTPPPALVLIDWEWIAVGPAVIDVADVLQRLPVMLKFGDPVPEAFWTDQLADYYFAYYRAAGGRYTDAAAWRRFYGLAVVAQGIVQMPFVHGSLLRAIRGEIPPPQIIGVPEAVIRQNLQAGLTIMQQMEQRVLREAHRWLK